MPVPSPDILDRLNRGRAGICFSSASPDESVEEPYLRSPSLSIVLCLGSSPSPVLVRFSCPRNSGNSASTPILVFIQALRYIPTCTHSPKFPTSGSTEDDFANEKVSAWMPSYVRKLCGRIARRLRAINGSSCSMGAHGNIKGYSLL